MLLMFRRSQDRLQKYWPETGIIQNKEDRGIQFGCEKLQRNLLYAIVDVQHTSLNLKFTVYVLRYFLICDIYIFIYMLYNHVIITCHIVYWWTVICSKLIKNLNLNVRRGQNRDLYWLYTLARLVVFITPPPKKQKS